MKKKAEKERNLLDQKFADLRQLIILGGAGERALLFDMQKILEGTEEQGELYRAVNGNTEEICTISRGCNPSCSNALQSKCSCCPNICGLNILAVQMSRPYGVSGLT